MCLCVMACFRSCWFHWLCVERGMLFALIIHQRKPVCVYFKHSNSLKYPPFSLAPFPAPGALITVGNDAVIQRGGGGGGGGGWTDRETVEEKKEKKKKRDGEILVVSVFLGYRLWVFFSSFPFLFFYKPLKYYS